MRTETKKINIYKFEELSEEIKQKLIEKEIEEQAEIYCQDCLFEDMKEEAERLLQKYFKNNAELVNIWYDLSYCQGSGAMIEFDLKYYNKNVKIKQYGHYYHKYSFIIDSWELTEKQEEQLKEKIIDMNADFTKYGFDLVDYRITEEEAKDILGDFEFLADGSIYN